MSTRGWYEYYTINQASKQMTLSMQFYKWGDATPGNALCEWLFFKEKLKETKGCLPVHLLDDMLKEQLKELYDGLPENFSVTAFLFMLQRASESLRYENRRWASMNVPLKQRPDYRLGYEIGKTMTGKSLEKYAALLNMAFSEKKEALDKLNYDFREAYTESAEKMDDHLKTVVEFIDIGNYIRPWKKYGLTFSVMEWLQYLTQVTLVRDMGSIAGHSESPWDHSFLYRLFIWLSREDFFKIDQIAIELCDANGESLFSTREKDDEFEKESFQEINAELSNEVDKYDIKIYSLSDANEEFELTADKFWKIKNYEYPKLTEVVMNYKY